MGKWFYEPDVSVMKAQGFRALAEHYEVSMLDTDCHYFTSAQMITDFPGRIFSIDAVFPFTSRLLKQMSRQIPQANIATRHFPLSADQLRQRSGIRDGGEVYLFGVTLRGVGPLIVQCHKANLSCQ